MSAHLHLDLLKDEERFSSSPIRLRIVVPMVASMATLSCLIWLTLLGLRTHGQVVVKRGLQESIDGLKAAHVAFIDLRMREKEAGAMYQQLLYYEHSRIRFGQTLAQLPDLVPANIQLTEMRVSPPPPPQVDSKQPELGPTNKAEVVTLRLSGRTCGDQGSACVNALLASLRKPAYSNLIQKAEIPKGAFRQDVGRMTDKRDALLFEITCTCVPRRFE
jgi:hypothetical protein